MIPYTTFGGNLLALDDIKAEDISLDAIAHSLAYQCRFNGHTTRFYSVAEHSMLLEHVVRSFGKPESCLQSKWEARRLAALLHDAAEAYFGDITTPVKERIYVNPHYGENVLREIFKAFGIPFETFDEPMQNIDKMLSTVEGFLLIGGTFWSGQEYALEASSYWITRQAKEYLAGPTGDRANPEVMYDMFRTALDRTWRAYIDAKVDEQSAKQEQEDVENS